VDLFGEQGTTSYKAVVPNVFMTADLSTLDNFTAAREYYMIRVPMHLKNSFSILFQYLFNTEFKKFNNITSLHFSKFLIIKLNFTHCTTLHK